jgi:hypothetical protein
MKILIGHSKYDYEREQFNIEKLFNHINSSLDENDYLFSHLVIDNVEVCENHEQYILDNIDKINKIDVIYKTQKEFVLETWKSTIAFIDEVNPQIEELAIDFYQNNKKDVWDRLFQFVDIVEQIFQSFDHISEMRELANITKESNDWDLYMKNISTLKEIIISFSKSIKYNDTVNIADALKWGVSFCLLQMRSQLEVLIEKGEADCYEG